MLLSLIVYATAVSLLLGLAAWTLERAVRALAFPTRWIWAAAMSGSLGFTLVAILWPIAASTPQATASATPLDAVLVPVVRSLTRLADPLPSGVGLDTLLGAGWAILSLVAASVLMGAHLRLVLERSAWSLEKLGGRDVLVSEDLGPGVVGWLRSAIVMPRWVMGMHPREQELMLRHETEHCKAGDARLIGAALLLRILLPWNVPLWWQIHRLRAAIEIDCDRRVVHRSGDVKRYAALLVEIGARRTASRWGALAFARPIPLIERRILSMTDTRGPRYMRMAGLTLFALLLVVASCQVEQVSINIEVEQATPDARGQMTPDARADAIEQAERILRTRIDEFGVEEPIIRRLPGTTDRIVVQSASLEFKLILPVSELEPALPQIDRQIVGALGSDSRRALSPFTSLLRSGDVEGAYLIATEDVDVAETYLALPEVKRALPRNISLHWEAESIGLQQTTYRRLIVTEEDAFVTGDMRESAKEQRDPQSNDPQVVFQFNRAGGRRFANFTTQHVGDRIAVILDGEVVSTPVVRVRVGASGVINIGNSALPPR